MSGLWLSEGQGFLLKSFRFKASASGLWDYLTHGSTGKEDSGCREYYLGPQPANSATTLRGGGWSHLAPHGIDLSLGLTAEQFEALCAGRAPDGTVLVPEMRGVHAPGIDLQSSPPKSVSIAMVLAGEETRAKIEAAHHEANAAMLDDIESMGLMSRVKCSGKTEFQSGKLLVFSATHHTSRPNAETIARGSPPDPQLHTHNFVFNVQWTENGWRGVEHRKMLHAQRAAEAIYQIKLHSILSKMGIPLKNITDRKGRNSFEVSGFEPKGKFRRLVHYCSSRAREVHNLRVKFEKQYGRSPTTKETIDLARLGRKHKESDAMPDWSDWTEHWAEQGFEVPDIEPGTVQVEDYAARKAETMRRLLGSSGLTKDGAAFQRWRVRAHVLNACVGLLDLEESLEFLEKFLTSDELVFIQAGEKYSDHDLMTTKTCLEQEQQTIETCFEKAKTRENHRASSEQSIARVLRRVEADLSREAARPVRLSDEQIAAVRSFVSSSGFDILEGEAGTGKSSTLRAVIDMLRDDECIDKAIVVSTAAATAEYVAGKIGADLGCSIESLSIKKLLGDLKPTADTIVFADESVMLDTPRFNELIDLIGPARLRLIGDPLQLQAIGAGGLHIDLAERLGVNRLTEVHRQKHEWYVDACRAIRAGAAERGLGLIAKHGKVHETAAAAEAIDDAVIAWSRHRLSGLNPEDIIVTTDQSNEAIDTLNRRIQAWRLENEELKKPGITVWCETYQRQETFYAGDIIMFTTGTDCGTDGYVRNGKSGKIEHVDYTRGIVTVRVGNKSIRVNLDTVAAQQPIRLAYAAHATRAQGREAKVVLVLPGRWQANLVSAYSMITRGSHAVEVFVSKELHGPNPMKALAALWSRNATKTTAEYETYLVDIEETFEPWDPEQDHMTTDEISVSTTTIGWHMNQRIRDRFRKNRQATPEMSRGL